MRFECWDNLVYSVKQDRQQRWMVCFEQFVGCRLVEPRSGFAAGTSFDALKYA